MSDKYGAESINSALKGVLPIKITLDKKPYWQYNGPGTNPINVSAEAGESDSIDINLGEHVVHFVSGSLIGIEYSKLENRDTVKVSIISKDTAEGINLTIWGIIP